MTAAPATSARVPEGFLRRLLARPTAVIALVVLFVIVAACLLAPVLAPFDPAFVDLTQAANAPDAVHVLGSDSTGRDVLSRLLFGGQVSLRAGLIATAVALIVGVPTGLLAGYYSGALDIVGNWIANFLLAIPFIIMLVTIISVTGPNVDLTMTVLGILMSPLVFRLVRASTLSVRKELFIDAARVSGLRDRRIIARHVLAEVRGPVVQQSALIFGSAMIIEAGIDFIGLGGSALISWGTMLADGFTQIYNASFLVVPPAVLLTVTVLMLSLLGTAVHDALEPGAVGRKLVRPVGVTRGGAPTGSAALLSITDLQVAYPGVGAAKTVVHGISIDVRRGEVVGLVGESGSGKTQTALSVLDLIPSPGAITGGTITLGGTDLLALSARERDGIRGTRIGFISQEPMANLDPSFTIGSQLLEPMRVHLKISKPEAKARALALLARVGIVDPERVFRSFPHQISGGMAQRVLIAAAVSCGPELLIADEPTTALDVTVEAEVLDLIRELAAETGMGVLFVTHDFGVVADICDRVVVMKDGRLIEQGEAAALFAAPSEPYTQALLAAHPENYVAVRRPMPERAETPLLDVSDLRIEFPGRSRRAAPIVGLADVSLTLRAGETLGVVGESGSGKTTLGRAILGLQSVTAGSIRFDGRDITAARGAQRRGLASDIQVVFQDPYSSLNPGMSVGEILIEPLTSTGTDAAAARAEIATLLDRVHLPREFMHRRARELSGGQRQRIAIARALARAPRLVICDEALSALDLTTQAAIVELLAEIQRDTGVSYLFIAHDLALVRHVSDRVVVMRHGDIVEQGDAEILGSRPTHPYTERLLNDSPVPDPQRQAARRARRLDAAAVEAPA